MEYKKAPISEVIFGLNYNKRKFSDIDVFAVNHFLSENFPIAEFVPPLDDQIMYDDNIVSQLDVSKTGTVMYRRLSIDRNKMIQLQGNKIYYNWIRQDNDNGDTNLYPGFDMLFPDFLKVITEIESLLKKKIDDDILMFDLTYQDRLIVGNSGSNLATDVYNDIKISNFGFLDSTDILSVNQSSSFKDSSLNGYGIVSVSSSSYLDKDSIISTQIVLRGAGMDMIGWMEKAHEKQLQIFESIFSERLSGKWK